MANDRPAHAEAVADEVREALAGDDAEARGHLLDDGQDDHRDGEQPEQLETRRGAHDRVGRDAAGVVAGDAGDEPRTHDGQEGEQASASEARAKSEAAIAPQRSQPSAAARRAGASGGVGGPDVVPVTTRQTG